MRQALADALVLDHPDAPWQPPAVLPAKSDISRGVALLEIGLAAGDRKHSSYCVGKLISGFNERLTKAEADLRMETWFEACSDVPNDLWSAGVIELLRSWKRDDHFGRVPDPSDFRDVIGTRLARRLVDLQRARFMLAKANEPELAAAKESGPVRFPERVRLKRILAEQMADPAVDETVRLFNCSNTERCLAFEERRVMEPWAQKFFDDRLALAGHSRESIGHQARVIAQRSSPSSRRMAELAVAHRTGKPAPESVDIPEL